MEIAKHKEQGAGRRERESAHTVWSKKRRGGVNLPPLHRRTSQNLFVQVT